MSGLEPGRARMSHPDPGVEDANVSASQVPHFENAGWRHEEGDRDTWPEELQRFGGQPQIRLYHPELDRYEVVAESQVPHLRSVGWMLAEEHETDQLEGKKVAELRELAKDRGISPIPSTKDELIAALEEQQQVTEDAGGAGPSEEEHG